MPAQSGRHDIQAYAGRGGITLSHHKSPFVEQTDMANIQIIQGDFEKKLSLAPQTGLIIEAISRHECIRPFVLVGGTALSILLQA